MPLVEYNWTEIHEYRVLEVKEAVKFVSDLLKGSKSPEYIKGAIDLLNKLMVIPKNMASEDDEEYVENMVNQEFSQVSLDLLRETMR